MHKTTLLKEKHGGMTLKCHVETINTVTSNCIQHYP